MAAASDQPSWSLGDPAIRWKSTSPQPASAWLAKDGLPLSRTGTVAITVGGRPTHEHDANRPGQWELMLAGTSAHPAELRVIDTPGALGFEPADALRAGGFKVKALCKPGGISSGAIVYTVEAPGHRAVVMRHEWSAGSAGTSVLIKFANAKSRAAKMQCE